MAGIGSSAESYHRSDTKSNDLETITPLDDNDSTASSASDCSLTAVSTNDTSTDASLENDPKSTEGNVTYYPHPTSFKISEHPIDQIRSLKVAVIGAGLSGLTAGALLPVKVPGIHLTIYEKNADVGGTWVENIYPGVRCDVPAHVYQSSFSPNTQWSEEYAEGPEIRRYWQAFARDHDCYSRIRFSTKVLGSYWNSSLAKWRLEVDHGGTKSTEDFDFVIHAIGRFNNWRLPNYPGMDTYKGHLCHSSNWDPTFDPTNKSIALIGNGASGIQLLPALRKVATHVDHYARSPTWIGGAFTPWLRAREEGAMTISRETRESYKDEATYLKFRKDLEAGFYRTYAGVISGSEASESMRPRLTKLMEQRLGKENKDLLERVVPDFPPHCRRLTPGPGYLEALTTENVTLVQAPIKCFTENGIMTVDGEHRPADAVICSTGANTDCAPPVPVVSGDYDLSRDWKPDGKFGFPYSYLGLGVPGFPNMSFVLGPNPAGPTGTLVNSAETQVAYIAKMLRKISSQGIRTMTPSKEAADDFVTYCDAFFPRTNLTKNCSSWSNGGVPGARIHGHWPGSSPHLNHVRREPRWEDFEYTYVRPENRFAYFGNGWTRKEEDFDHNMTQYLKKRDENDLRNLHELWWDL